MKVVNGKKALAAGRKVQRTVRRRVGRDSSRTMKGKGRTGRIWRINSKRFQKRVQFYPWVMARKLNGRKLGKIYWLQYNESYFSG